MGYPIDSERFRHLAPQELRLVRDVYRDISAESWFERGLKAEFAAYVISMYQRGMVDPEKLKALCSIAARRKFSSRKNNPVREGISLL